MTADEMIELIWAYRQTKIDSELPDNDYDLDRCAVEGTVKELTRKGWAQIDIIGYTQSLEHVDPTLNEDVALRMMAEISSKYRMSNICVQKDTKRYD